MTSSHHRHVSCARCALTLSLLFSCDCFVFDFYFICSAGVLKRVLELAAHKDGNYFNLLYGILMITDYVLLLIFQISVTAGELVKYHTANQ